MVCGFLALTLLCPTADPVGLQKGDQLTYTGTVSEAVNRPGNHFRRSHRLEVRVIVLEVQESWTDAAVLTLLRRTEDGVAEAVSSITGGRLEKNTTPAVRLDLVRVHADGTSHQLNPAGPPPLIFDAKTPARTLPSVLLDSFAPFEFGMFPPRPPRSSADKPWTIAAADLNRPAETWQVQRTEFVTAERCALLVMNQEHANWAQPVGGKSAWHRADAVWVSTLDGTARKVHRVIKHRDGIDTDLAAWVEVKYELKDQTRLIGRTFDRYRRDVETAYAASAEIAPFLPDAVKHGAKFFETRLAKIDAYLSEADDSSPYIEAVRAVRRQLDAARRGETALKVAPLLPAAKRPEWPRVGQIAPDFTAGKFRLAENRGKPIVLVFFNPKSDTTPLTLAIADALHQKYGSRAAIVPLAIWEDAPAEATGPPERKATVPIYPGTQADAAYGVESEPRFMILDGKGIVKWTFAGVGAETGHSAREQLERLFPQASPNSATGTTGTPGKNSAELPPRP